MSVVNISSYAIGYLLSLVQTNDRKSGIRMLSNKYFMSFFKHAVNSQYNFMRANEFDLV